MRIFKGKFATLSCKNVANVAICCKTIYFFIWIYIGAVVNDNKLLIRQYMQKLCTIIVWII
mgnify:FL=1